MTQSQFQILCIDDDEFMLKATHRLVRRLKPDWTLNVTSDPINWEQHIDASSPPSLVVSDLLMPKLRGDELLKQIAVKYPATIRAMMTGDSTRNIPELAIANAHFILPKPFSEQDFSYVLDSVERLHQLPFSEATKRQLAGLESVPVLPSRIRKILQALRDPEFEIEQLSRMVSEEPALVTRLLQLSNSAYLGFQNQTMSVEVAINRLGLVVTGAIATCMLSQKVFHNVSVESHQAVVDHYLQLAGVCRSLSQKLNFPKSQQECIYLAALFGSLGELVLLEMGVEKEKVSGISSIEENHLDALVIASYVLILWGYQLDIAVTMLASDTTVANNNSDIDAGQIIRVCRQWLHKSHEEQRQLCMTLPNQLAEFFQGWPE